MEKIIDLNTWPRKGQYDLFKNMDIPHFNLCANVDITLLRKYVKDQNINFYVSMVYIASHVANNMKSFRLRMRGDQVIEHDMIHPSFTIMTQDETFSFCSVNHNMSFKTFYDQAEKQKEKLMGNVFVEDELGRSDYIFMTSIPWISFTSMSHPMSLDVEDCVPRFAWGKYFKDHEKILMPFSVQVHHAMMDGYHVGMFYEKLQEALNQPGDVLNT